MKFFCRNHYRWKKVRHFHPDGKDMPNGSFFHRGGYISECVHNSRSFILDERVHRKKLNRFSRQRGGIIIFQANTMEQDEISRQVSQAITTSENRMTDLPVNVGHSFIGRYVGTQGELFNEASISVEIFGLSTKHLLDAADLLAWESHQPAALVKDLNTGAIYFMDQHRP